MRLSINHKKTLEECAILFSKISLNNIAMLLDSAKFKVRSILLKFEKFIIIARPIQYNSNDFVYKIVNKKS